MKRSENKRAGLKRAFIIIVIAALAILALTDFITNWIWFDNLGYTGVFFTELAAKVKIGVPAFIVTLALGLLFLSALKKSFLKKADMVIDSEPDKKRLRGLMLILSAVFSVIATVGVVSELWFDILQFFNAQDFGVADPLFGKDISFYTFKLEFLTDLTHSVTRLVLILFGITLVFYILLMGFAKPRLKVESGADADPDEDDVYNYEAYSDEMHEDSRNPKDLIRRLFGLDRNQVNGIKKKTKAMLFVASGQVTALAILFFLSIAVNYALYRYQLLYGGAGVAYGAGYADMSVTLNVCRAMIVLATLSAIGIIVAIKKHKIRIAVVCPALMLILFFLAAPIAQTVQNLVVSPDELNKESRYLDYNIRYTRSAYGLDKIVTKDFTPQSNITQEDVLNNMETFANIRVNDFEPTEQYYNQTQSIRSYYTFNDVDVDRYNINGEYSQVFLSAREIDPAKIDDSWLIQHLKYTHGYGFTLSRVDTVTASGQPDVLVSNIPTKSQVPEIKLERPEVYFGEFTNNYVVVNSLEDEFDYPSGESNVYCKYEAGNGIPATFFNRLMFSLKTHSFKLLISNNITKDSQILIYRNIAERVQKIAPFLLYDDDPYIVVENGQLYWIINAYTYSSYYPYSEPYQAGNDMNYIRNSVKATVNAYTGETDFYICDAEDPIAATLGKIYPGLFKPLSDMPEFLQQHLQYPITLMDIQAKVYEKYHTTDVEVFYQKEDVWAVANELYGQTEVQLTPINFIMRLPGEDNAEFIASLPYTPKGKANMTGLLIARSDGANYGQLVLYRLPKDKVFYGPTQIEAQISQDSDIAKEFSLWSNSGVQYSRGNLFVFPVNDSLIYCEPIFMESTNASLPELKRVVMYYGDKVAYEPTLAECLDNLFGAGTGNPLSTVNPIETGRQMAEELRKKAEEPEIPDTEDPDTPDIDVPLTLQELAKKAYDYYRNAVNAQKNDDWAAYGQYKSLLEDILKQMNK